MALYTHAISHALIIAGCLTLAACGGGGGGGGGNSGGGTATPTPTIDASPTPTPTPTATPTATPTPEGGPYTDIITYSIFGDVVNTDLTLDYRDDGAHNTQIERIVEGQRGNVMTIDKVNEVGDIFFSINSGAKDLTYWVDGGKIIFDLRVNSGTLDYTVKMESNTSEQSSYAVTASALSEWRTFEIPVAALVGSLNLASVENVFVLEPSNAANFSIDNVRLFKPFAPTPQFMIFDDTLNGALQIGKWDNNSGSVNIMVHESAGRGDVLTLTRSNSTGNAFISINGGSKNMEHWVEKGKLMFDMKVNDGTADQIDIKIDSTYPNIGYTTLTPASNEWESYEIAIADLIEGSNVNMKAILNVFVVEPHAGTIDVSFDNIRWETPDLEQFAPLPSYTLFDDALSADLVANTWDNDSSTITLEITEEAGRGNIFTMDKTTVVGNAFLTIESGSKDLAHYTAGAIKFDMRVNSSDGSDLAIKIDSVHPAVSGYTIENPSQGVWETVTIPMADLMQMGDAPANLHSINNMFVIEPLGVMNISFDNIEWIETP